MKVQVFAALKDYFEKEFEVARRGTGCSSTVPKRLINWDS